MVKLLFILVLKMDMNKLFKFYWKKEEQQMLILQIRFFIKIIILNLFFLVSFSSFSIFSLFFTFSFFDFLFIKKRMEQLLFILLLEMGINKLFKFYWKKEEQMWILKDWFSLSLSFSLFCSFSLFFSFLFFFFFSYLYSIFIS